jgi:hypothetical protein
MKAFELLRFIVSNNVALVESRFILIFYIAISIFLSNEIFAQVNQESNRFSDESINNYSSISYYPTSNNENYDTLSNSEINQLPESDVVFIDDQIASSSTLSKIDETADRVEELDDKMLMSSGPLSYKGLMRIDDDGYGSSHGDPKHDNETSLKVNGKSLNADVDSYVVVPRNLLGQGVKVGDRVDVSAVLYWAEWDYYWSSSTTSIVGDVGPSDKGVGEVSIAAARALGFGTRDVPGVGPVPTWYGVDCDPMVTVTYYPSGY